MRIIRLRELYYACSTIFFREVRCKTGRVVGEADPYGSVIDGAVRRGDVGIGPYGGLQEVPVCGAMWASPPTEGYKKCLCAGRCGHRPLRRVTRSACVRADVGIGSYGDYLKFLDGRCGCCDFL